ncbi:HIG1 domain family member 1A, mitochondrial [Platysternon megacephalum]|uniref:HIG1 domain family member 1A, mitochondrial n=1 Tax=Platysternon megacephalum TaxID=55544 RepID=A0A4D9DWY5_9SAUR|nr:HIG1 domain family member 1A, mitochondrial [Platysternon megacephalum]
MEQRLAAVHAHGPGYTKVGPVSFQARVWAQFSQGVAAADWHSGFCEGVQHHGRGCIPNCHSNSATTTACGKAQPMGTQLARRAQSKANPDQNGLFCSLSSSLDGAQSVGTCWATPSLVPSARALLATPCMCSPRCPPHGHWAVEQCWELQGRPLNVQPPSWTPFSPTNAESLTIGSGKFNVFLKNLSPFGVFSGVFVMGRAGC